ncbi:DUF1758 domain-containing protein [Trichonephila clavipes]|nr:DUF1758 domain-containing protein [Trichonephila clavipes]
MAEAQSFELLKTKRKSLRTAVNKIVNELEAELSNSDLNVDRLCELVEILCIKFEPLTLVHQQMEPLFKPEEFDVEFEITEKFREKVLLWQFRAKKKINEFSKTPVTSPSLQTTLSQSQDEHFQNTDNIRIKVPKYHITRFYGDDASKWRILGGSALNTVEGFPISAKAYDEAVELLKNRFANLEILIQAHMNKILSLQPLKNSNDFRSFRKFVDNCNVQLRSLNSLGVSSANYGKILCPMLFRLIPSDLVLDYNKLQQKDSGSDIQHLLSFLTQSLTAREQTYSTNKSYFELCNLRQETKSNFSREPRSYKQQNQKGSDIIGKLFTGEVKQLSEGLTAVNTRLGWTVMGKLSCGFKLDNSLLVHSLFTNREKISDLWELDSLRIKDPSEKKSKLELQDLALKHFENTVLRDDEGRYIVRIPWIEGNEKLEDHYSLAKGRLEKTVKTLKFTGRLFDYEQVFVDWEKEGIIEKIAQDEPKNGGKFHYLPHRPVFKENSTTEIRPVFDGSAHHGKSCSLNDCVEKGPNLIEMIPAILNRFRLGKIGVISDIRKAFLQISLHENDMNFLRFSWWEGGYSEKAVIYRHRRVVFGISRSPFLLAAVLNHHFKQAPEHLEKAAEKLKDSMYVDNCVASVDSSKGLESFQRDSTELLALGKFDLRGWRHSDIESNFDFQDNQQKSDPEEILVLRLMWNVKEDTFSISYRETESKEEVTKRRILSLTHRYFDPIGFTCPITLVTELLIEECWKIETSWNSKLQIDIERKFERWKTNLQRYKTSRFHGDYRISILKI